MQSITEKWEEMNAVAAMEFEHRKVLNRCGFCFQTCNLQWCPQCQVRQYCCEEHRQADRLTHRQFCRPPIQDNTSRVVRGSEHKTLPLEERRKTTDVIVNIFFDSLSMDVYPPEEFELIFGIQMVDDSDTDENEFHYVGIDTPVGSVMYGCWMFIFKCNSHAYDRDIAGGQGIISSGGSEMEKMDMEDDVSAAYQFDVSGVNALKTQVMLEARATLKLELVQTMLEGRLPHWFRSKLSELDTLWVTDMGRPQDAYVAEIKRRDFKGIKWDYAALATLSSG